MTGLILLIAAGILFILFYRVAGLEDCDSRHTMKQKRKNCEKCYKQIGNEEKLCEQCVITIEKDILDINERDNIGACRGGCFTSLNKSVGGAWKQLASKVTSKLAALKVYGDEASRRATFIGEWPSRLSHDMTESFARWGFFYTGCGDLVRCFQCGIGLRGWSASDDPLKEHIRYSPYCQHLQNSRSFHMNQILEVAIQCFNSQSQTDVSLERNVVLHRLPTGGVSTTKDPGCATEDRPVLPLPTNTVQTTDHDSRASLNYNENDIHTMMDENKTLKRRMTCIVCSRDRKKILFLPCQHLMVCQSCGTELEVCPSCDKPVKEKIIVKFYPDY